MDVSGRNLAGIEIDCSDVRKKLERGRDEEPNINLFYFYFYFLMRMQRACLSIDPRVQGEEPET